MLKAIERRNSEGYLALIAEYKRASPSGGSLGLTLTLGPTSTPSVNTPRDSAS
ncbi:hypothetical protein [Vulcanisaeta distributa]|uniref:hypothetical protein n=1 Tax=Vulcanisaeta distributa TaxID=164451 RepID=UPI000A8F979B|nr:hypothetical protein [Vulcanisaeta distributa]